MLNEPQFSKKDGFPNRSREIPKKQFEMFIYVFCPESEGEISAKNLETRKSCLNFAARASVLAAIVIVFSRSS